MNYITCCTNRERIKVRETELDERQARIELREQELNQALQDGNPT